MAVRRPVIKLGAYGIGWLLVLASGLLFFEQRVYNSPEPLIVLTCSDSAPFVFHNGKELVGFDIDLIRHVGRKIRRRVYIVDLPYPKLLERLRLFSQDNCDVGIAAITPTKSLKRLLDFSTPYHISDSALLVPNNSAIKCWQDLSQATLGVRQNTVQEAAARANVMSAPTEIKLVSIPAITSKVRKQLCNGQLTGLLLSTEEAQIEASRSSTFRAIPVPKANSHYCIALHKRSSLTPRINKALAALSKEGVIADLEKTWLAQGDSPCF